MKKISELAQLFAKYKIYPQSCYNDCSPVRVFQGMFLENHYSKDLETFLYYQNYKPTQRGADLPWWGKKFFSGEIGIRVLLVGQDSLIKDAGSIVLFSHLVPVINNKDEYKEYTDKLNTKKPFSFYKWNKIKTQLAEWRIDFNFLYMTDASKVYKNGSWEDGDFDKEKSKELLGTEIEFCNPNFIIFLGGSPLYLLEKTKKYASVVESGKPILIEDKKCVVAPFLIGNGPAQPNFKRRLETATRLIKKLMKK